MAHWSASLGFWNEPHPPGTARVDYQIIATRASGGRASRGDPAVFPEPFSEVPVERALEGSRAA